MLWRSLPDWRHGFGTSSGQSRAPGLMAPFDASTRARPTMEGSWQRPQRAPPAINRLPRNIAKHLAPWQQQQQQQRPPPAQLAKPLSSLTWTALSRRHAR